MAFKDKLKEFLLLRDMKPADLARNTGISEAVISNYLSGKREPMGKMCMAIAAALNVSIDELLESPFAENEKMKREQKEIVHNGLSAVGQHLSNTDFVPKEIEHIKKYRALDEHGKTAVNSILDIEFTRMEKEKAARDQKKLAIEDEPENVTMIVHNQPSAAGLGSYLSDNGEADYDEIEFPAYEIPKGADFGVRISGDSMEPDISDGDIVWVKSQPEIQSGQIGIFVVDGNAFCKKLHVDHEKREIALLSTNPKYDDIQISEYMEMRTIGRVLSRKKNDNPIR